MIAFTVPGDPKAQGRPRFFVRRHATGGQKLIGSQDPVESKNFKNKVAFFALRAGVKLMEGPVSISIICYVRRPKKFDAKKYPITAIPCPCRPDLDNYLKAVMDALNGIAYHDDAQIFRAISEKFYHAQGESQRTSIYIRPQSGGEPEAKPFSNVLEL